MATQDKERAKERLVEIIETITDPEMIEALSEDEMSALVAEFSEIALNPRGSDIIFYPTDDEKDLTAEELAEKAMDYQPIQLS